mmetsp:Transcript_14714/g.22455  ORF Transcript_14714/g.22455 Transcript_14714/m.22455 type:complete len:107 (-) Transcript_14714:1273-1593(-)
MTDNDDTLNSPARRVPKTSTLSINKEQQQKEKAKEKDSKNFKTLNDSSQKDVTSFFPEKHSNYYNAPKTKMKEKLNRMMIIFPTSHHHPSIKSIKNTYLNPRTAPI